MGRGEGCVSSAPVAPTSAVQQHEAAAVPTHPSKAQRSDGNDQDAWTAGYAALPAAAALAATALITAAPVNAVPVAAAAAPHAADVLPTAPPPFLGLEALSARAASALQRAGGKTAAWEATAERADAACARLGDEQPGQTWPPKTVRRLLCLAASPVRNEFLRCSDFPSHCSEVTLQCRSRFRAASLTWTPVRRPRRSTRGLTEAAFVPLRPATVCASTGCGFGARSACTAFRRGHVHSLCSGASIELGFSPTVPAAWTE